MSFKIELPDDFTASYSDGVLEVEGEDGSVEKKMQHALVQVDTSDDVVFESEVDKSDIRSIAKTFRSHTENMVEGLQNSHVYHLKGVYAHFPMTIKTQSNQLVVENFMGERNPRKADIMEGVSVSVDGEEITVEGSDKENVAQTAARIEQLSEKGNRDPRTFQDGIYITEVEE